MLASAMSSSSSGARLTHSDSRCAMISASSPSSSSRSKVVTDAPPPPARSRTSDAGTPCPPPGRRTSPSRPGSTRGSPTPAPPRSTRPPGAGCRGREHCAAPSRRQGRAGCPRDCGSTRGGDVRRPPTVARSRGMLLPLGGVGGGRLAYPGAVVVRGAAVGGPLPVARPVALDHPEQLLVVRLGVRPVAAVRILPQVRIGQRQPQNRRLLYAHVHELLAQLVVGEPLDVPRHRLRGVGGLGVRRAEHRQRRVPPAVDGVLRHLALRVGAVGARLIQLPSGCIPMISEWACWAICRISVLRYASGIQSRGSIFWSAEITASKWSCSSSLAAIARSRSAAVRSSCSASATCDSRSLAPGCSGASSGPGKSLPYTSQVLQQPAESASCCNTGSPVEEDQLHVPGGGAADRRRAAGPGGWASFPHDRLLAGNASGEADRTRPPRKDRCQIPQFEALQY